MSSFCFLVQYLRFLGSERMVASYMKLHVGEKIKVSVDSINSQGDGVARFGEERFVFFVPGALPGEEVEGIVRILKRHYGVMELTDVLTPCVNRVIPKCSWYGLCGGCSLQHADYAMQLEIKKRIVFDAFMKTVGKEHLDKIQDCVPSPKKWCYRNKASFPVKRGKKNLNVGFYMKGSHRIIPINSCCILEEGIDYIYRRLLENLSYLGIEGYDEKKGTGILRHLVLRRTARGDKAVILVLRNFGKKEERSLRSFMQRVSEMLGKDISFYVNVNPHKGNRIFGERTIAIKGKEGLSESICGKTLFFGPTSFFQVNRDVAELLFQEVKNALETSGADHVTELYCGVGAITVTYGENVKSVTAVESWPESVLFLRKNIELNKLNNVRVLEGDVEEFAPDALFGEDKVVLLDPPRSGCAKGVLEGIIERRPKAVIYVSCNPATLARDVSILMNGGYELSFVKPFDMFPMTAHVESMALLTREKLQIARYDKGCS